MITDSEVNSPTYSIKVNENFVIENQSWTSGQTISFDVSGWQEGTYTVTIIANDGNGGEVIDVVIVTVTGIPNDNPFSLESIPGFNIVYLVGFSLIGLVLIKRKRIIMKIQ